MQVEFVKLGVARTVARIEDVATIGREGWVRMGVLWRVYTNRAMVIGERPGPVVPYATRLGITKSGGAAYPITGVEELDSDVGEVGIGDHACAGTVTDWMPGVEGANLALRSSVYLDSAHPMGPVNDCQFTRAGNPGLMGDPFPWCSLVNTAVT